MATENSENKRSGGGGKLARSVIVTVRMDSQLHYLAELAARKHRRTLSSFVEWAVQQSFKSVEMYHGSGYNQDETVFLSDMETKLWDVDQSERFVKLAILYPDLLTHEEQERWKMLTDSQLLSPAMQRLNGNRSWDWAKLEDVVFPVLRRAWGSLLVAHEAGPEAARKWVSATQANITTIYKGAAPGTPSPTPIPARPAPIAAPARPPPIPARPSPVAAPVKPKPASGFDDMDDDIPF
jgi:hypothetical protein